MNYIVDFIQSEPEKSKIYKELECEIEEIKILKFITKNYLLGNISLNVRNILCEIFGEEDYKFLEHLKDIKNLSDFGYINYNFSFNAFKQNDLTKNLTATKLSLLQADVELSEYFLKLLEDGKFSVSFPEVTPYLDNLEYLKDQFLRIDFYYKRLNAYNNDIRNKINEKIAKIEEIIAQRIKKSKISLSVEQIFKSNSLNIKEQIIFLALLKEEYSNEFEVLRDMNTLISIISDDELEKIKNRALFEEGATLLSNSLIDYDEIFDAVYEVNRSFFINEDVLQSIMHPKTDKKTNKLILENIIKKSEIFELIEPNIDINDVILNPKTKDLLDSILKQLDKKVIARLNSWGIKNKKSIDTKVIFYGPAGTGKTMSAVGLAKSLKKQIISFDCSKILSKMIGESEQNVRKIFDVYKEIKDKTKNEPVLLLNEADQFLSGRVEGTENSADKMYNQMQNIFLEQIEKFEGVLIATTNLLKNIDGAFSRRFDYKIEFKRPKYNERLIIWRKIMPENANFEENFNVEELAKYNLSGAQIALVLKNTALKVAVRDDGIFTMEDFIHEIKREIASSFDEDIKVGLL